MTIEERLERLTGRHEALTQTGELMAAESRDRNAQLDKAFGELGQRVGELSQMMGQVTEAIARLVHVAEIHEQRLDRLEGEQH